MASSSVFVFADNTTSAYSYYQAGSTLNPYTVSTNKNSADMLGYVLQVLSLNQSRIYDKMSSMSSGGNDYTTVLNNIFGHVANISNDLEAPVVAGTDKLFYVGDTLSYINRPFWQNGDGIGELLQAYMSAMSYNLVSTYNSIQDVVSNTSVLSGIKTDTSNLSAILTGVTDFKTANHTDITSVKTSVDNFKTANHTDITSVKTSVDNFKTANHDDITAFQSDFNNINWNVAGNVTGVFNGDGSELTSSSVNNVSTTFLLNSALGNIYYMVLPFANDVFTNTDPKYEIGLIRSGVYQPINDAVVISALYNVSSTTVIFYIPNNYPVGTYNYYIKATTNQRFWVTQSIINSYPNVYGISKDKKDFYDVASWVDLDNIYKLFKQAKEMYFDDETLAAKRANASQTTTVLSNYTGNGSASASAADFGNIKDSVGSVKSGLNTNVSVSNIFNIFNNNDGYGFWSDDTRNELNSTRSNRANYKTRGVSDTPLYDAKINELYNAMGVKHD